MTDEYASRCERYADDDTRRGHWTLAVAQWREAALAWARAGDYRKAALCWRHLSAAADRAADECDAKAEGREAKPNG